MIEYIILICLMKDMGKIRLSTTHIIMLSFLTVILVGSVLLALPVSSADGEPVPYLDALFTSASATCVTGLVTLPTVSTWSVFGQVVILLLIQVGGLGVVTIVSGLMMLFHKRLGIGGRLLLQDAFNLNTMSGLIRFLRRVLLGTLIVEGVGAVFYMMVFVPDFGARGIWISVFTSVSAFCNAGIDIIAENSLCDYAVNPLINIVTCLLIIFGGIGYIVWWDVIRVTGGIKGKGLRTFKELTLQSKIAISASLFLVLAGAVLIFILEYDNPLTIGGHSTADKVQLSFFQSVTTRTAGFATVDQGNLTDASSMVCLLLMFIGGSPIGTAGGIKTVTIVVLAATAIATIKNREEANLFGRALSKEAIGKAVAVSVAAFFIVFISAVALSAVTDAPAIDVVYEAVSAAATVGLTRNLTPLLNNVGKMIIILTMYLGRVGPISLAMALNTNRKNQNIVSNPTEDISVG